MDMNRKSRFGLKNKIYMISSFMKKLTMVLAVFGMLAGTAYAGPDYRSFLTNETGESSKGVNIDDADIVFDEHTGVSSIDLYDREDNYDRTLNIYNFSGSRPDPDNVSNTISDAWNGSFGYTADDYTAFDDGDNNSDAFYIGTFEGHQRGGGDPDYVLLELIEFFLRTDITDYGYLKVEVELEEDENGNEIVIDGEVETTDDQMKLNVTYESDLKSGTWSVTKNEQSEAINFYSVKGADEFALYYVHPAQSSGKWTTAHLINPGSNQPGISHFSVLLSQNIPPSGTGEVPEPATMLLFGFSLIGLAGMARRKNSKF